MIPFVIHPSADPGTSPVVFDTAHSGTILPVHFRYACTRQDLMYLHDPHVEQLLSYIPNTGVPVLESLIHRSCIDLNRFEDEISPVTIHGHWPHHVRKSRYTQQGRGVFPQLAGPRSNRIAPIYNALSHPLTPLDAEHRIRVYHRPYYAALAKLVNAAQAANGRALHVDVHSFTRNPFTPQPDIMIGDMNGKSCQAATTTIVADFFRAAGFTVGFNGNYFSGGALIRTTTDAARNIESIQVEIARDLYMDQATLAYDIVRGEKIARTMEKLAKTLNI